MVYFVLGETGWNCSAALAYSLLESSSELCCLFWCKQSSAPGSSGSELWCLNRWLGYTPSMTERHWNAVSRISRTHCPVLARGAEGRQRWKRTLLYLVWHVKHWACGNSRLHWYGTLKGSCDSAGAMLFLAYFIWRGKVKKEQSEGLLKGLSFLSDGASIKVSELTVSQEITSRRG